MPEWSTDTRDLVAATIAAHVDTIRRRDDDGTITYGISCSCGAESEVVLSLPEWDIKTWMTEFRAHRADAVLTALTEAGALLPAGGETVDQYGFELNGQPAGCCYDSTICGMTLSHQHRYARVRTKWTDGRVYYGPWREVPDAE